MAGNCATTNGQSMVKFDSYTFGGSVQQPMYTTTISNLNVVASMRVDNCLEVNTCDGLTISGTYLTLGKNSEVYLNASKDNEIITGLIVDGGYLDANSQTAGSENAILVSAITGTAATINTVKFSDLFIANATGDLVKIVGAVSDFQLNDCTTANCIGSGVVSTGVGSEVIINGGSIKNTGNDSASAVVNVSDATIFSHSNVIFKDNFAGVTTSNISNYTASNANGTGVYVEDVFRRQGTWIPQLRFGNGTTGIIYGTQKGYYQRIGKFIYFTMEINLTSKGTDTGSATISGFPLESAVALGSTFSVSVNAMDSALGGQYIAARMLDAATQISILDLFAGVASPLLDTDFGNTSLIIMSGVVGVV